MTESETRGRPERKFSKADRENIERYRACGMSLPEIAGAMNCAIHTLTKHCADELERGHGVQLAKMVDRLFLAAEKGNGGILRYLHEMMRAGSASHEIKSEPARMPRIGKKEEAERIAVTAGVGTDWGGDLTPPSLFKN